MYNNSFRRSLGQKKTGHSGEGSMSCGNLRKKIEEEERQKKLEEEKKMAADLRRIREKRVADEGVRQSGNQNADG